MAAEWSEQEERRFLEALYAQAAKEGDSPEDVAERIYQSVAGMSRRDMLKGGGALGLGALLGGGGGLAATTGARAAASTTDSDGNVGTPSDPVDGFFDGVDATSVNTGSLNNGGPVSDGDGTERQVWIIANGASDPAGADAEDIIFEEQA